MIWAPVIGVAAAAALLMQFLAMPAAWMLGPLIVGIAFACAGVHRRVPRPFIVACQATIGCLFARAFTPAVVASVAAHLPVMLVVILMTIAVSVSCGWLLARTSSIAPMTAAFGSTPGNAVAMITMSADYGADPRIVAFMQYIRVIFVVMTASLVARFVFHVTPGIGNPLLASAGGSQLGSFEAYAETIGVAFLGVFLARTIHFPSPNVVGPLVFGATLSAFGLVHIAIPIVVLDAAYLTVGLSIGLLFTVAALRYVVSILPQLIATTITLIAFCALVATALSKWAHVDPFTAYLATSPGGLDSVAIIAVTSGGDLPVVLSLQVLRVFVVALICPTLAQFIGKLPRSRLSAREVVDS
jgi:membrane AbrB-like protein